MRIVAMVRERVRAVLFRSREEREMEEELAFHMAQEVAKRRAMGLDEAAARRAAVIAFGGADAHREGVRDARGGRWLEAAVREVRLASRGLGRNRGYSAVAMLTMAVGIGGVTAMFGVVNRVLLQPLPYPEAGRLVAIGHAVPGLGLAAAGLSSGTYFHYRERSRTLEAIGLYTEGVQALSRPGEVTERIGVTRADPELFRMLGVRPALGRLFTEADGAPGFMNVSWTIPVLLSHGTWQRRYGGDSAIVGRIITLGDSPREVVGVLPASFTFPRPETEIWMLDMPPEVSANLAQRLDYGAIGRVRPGASAADAEAELVRILPEVVGRYADATPERLAELQLAPRVVPLADEVVGEMGGVLWILFGGLSFLLLVSCANVANLFLVRATGRAREVAVRAALGARRGDLIGLFVAESLVLCGAGAVAGVVLAAWGLRLLVLHAPIDLPRLHEVRLDGWALAFTAGIAILTALVFGGIAFLRQARGSALPTALKGGGTPVGEVPERRRTLDLLVGVQVALALSLMAGSVLMLQSFLRLTDVRPGFESDGVLVVDIGIPNGRALAHQRMYEGLLERLRVLPGVEGAAAVSTLPLDGEGHQFPVRVAEPGAGDVGSAPVALRFFLPGYFETMRTPALDGSVLAPRERVAEARPVVLSASLARRLFPDGSPIGRPVSRLGEDGTPVTLFDRAARVAREVAPYTVAGVVADVRGVSLREGPTETLYVPVLDPRVEASIIPTQMSVVIRSTLPLLELAGAVRSEILAFDPVISVAGVRTLDEIVRASTATERFLALMLLIAAGVALFLGAVGIYGVGAYTVRRRAAEIGLRVALGARPGTVGALVLRGAVVPVMAGAAAGLAAALWSTRALRSLLFEVNPADPLALLSVTLILVAVALAASLPSALRAARVDPARALRSD